MIWISSFLSMGLVRMEKIPTLLAEAGMSFLGIGVQPPDASLGRMLSEAQSFLFSVPMYALFPGLTIILLVLGFGLLSDGLKNE